MAGVKTAISIEKKLFDEINKLAKQLHVSRSHLFALAVEDYLKKYENKNLLARINAAYDDVPTQEEVEIKRAMKQKHRKSIETERW